MGSLLSKEGATPDPPKEVVEPKSTDSRESEKTEDIPKTDEIKITAEEKVISNHQTQEEVKSNGDIMVSQQKATHTEDILKTGEIKNTPAEEKVILNQQTQEEVKSMISQKQSTDTETSLNKGDQWQELNTIDTEKTVKSNETTKELKVELTSGVQPSPCVNALNSTTEVSHNSIQPQQANDYHSVKSTLNGGQLNQNNQLSNVYELGKKESHNEVKMADVRTSYGADNKIQEPAITWRTPVDDVKKFVGTSFKPRVGITEESPPKLIYNPSIRAEKTTSSYYTKPVNLNYYTNIPLSFVWTVPTIDNFPKIQRQGYKTADYNGFSRLSTHNVVEPVDSKKLQGMHLEQKIEKTYVKPAAAIVWTIPDENHKAAKPIQSRVESTDLVDSVKHQGVHLENQIETKDKTVSPFTWTIPSKTQEQIHPAAKSVNSGERHLQLEEKIINKETNSVAAFPWTVPHGTQERSKTKVETAPISETNKDTLSHTNPSVSKFDIWWPSAQADSLRQSDDGTKTPDNFLNPSHFQINVEKHISLYSREDLASQKISENEDHVKTGMEETSSEITKRVQSAWDASKRRQVEDYMDYLRGFRSPSQSTQPSSLESGGSNDNYFGPIPTKVVGEYNLNYNVSSSQKTMPTTENKILNFDPVKDPVPYSKDYLKDGGPPLSNRKGPVKSYISAKFPSESIPGHSEATSTRKWTPGRSVPEFQEVSKEDILSGLKSHQEINKLSPLPGTSTRRYPRGGPGSQDNKPIGYRNNPGRENQPLGYQNNPGRENQPPGYRNNQRWLDQPPGYQNNRGQENEPLRYQYNPGSYRPGNDIYQNHESNNYRSKSQTYRFKRYESPSEVDNSPNAPELVRMNSIRHEHLENDSGSLS